MGILFSFFTRARIALPLTIPPAMPLERWEDSFYRQFRNTLVDDDFMFLICDIERSWQLHALFADIQAYLVEINFDFASAAVARERDLIRRKPMGALANSVDQSTRFMWTEDPAYFAARVSEFNERIHTLKMSHRR